MIEDLVEQIEPGNKQLLEYVSSHKKDTVGPVTVTLDELIRTVGPERNFLNKEAQEQFDSRVSIIAEEIRKGHQAKPLVIEDDSKTMIVLDGNHTLEALKKLGIKRHEAYVVHSDEVHRLGQEPSSHI